MSKKMNKQEIFNAIKGKNKIVVGVKSGIGGFKMIFEKDIRGWVCRGSGMSPYTTIKLVGFLEFLDNIIGDINIEC